MNKFFEERKEKSNKKNLIYYCGISDPCKWSFFSLNAKLCHKLI